MASSECCFFFPANADGNGADADNGDGANNAVDGNGADADNGADAVGDGDGDGDGADADNGGDAVFKLTLVGSPVSDPEDVSVLGINPFIFNKLKHIEFKVSDFNL